MKPDSDQIRNDRKRPTAKDLQREATRARLLDAARRLFGRHGYHGVSTTEIAREAGVTHGLIHAHFHAKAGLLHELLREANRQEVEAAWAAARKAPTLETRLAAILRVYAEGDAADPEVLGVLQSYGWQWPPALEARHRAQVAEALAPLRWALGEAVAAGELRADLDLARIGHAIFAIRTMTLRPLVFDGAAPADCAAEALAQIMLLIDGARPR